MTVKYDLYCNEEFVGRYSLDEISEITGIDKYKVSVYEKEDRVYGGKYTFRIAYNYNDFSREWDKARMSILNAPDIIKREVVVKQFTIWKQKPERRTVKKHR